MSWRIWSRQQAAAQVKIERFPHVPALRAALRRRLRDAAPTDGGSGSGTGGRADAAKGGLALVK